MYLQDGDLYTEGAGRMRNFRWKDIGKSLSLFVSAQLTGECGTERDERIGTSNGRMLVFLGQLLCCPLVNNYN